MASFCRFSPLDSILLYTHMATSFSIPSAYISSDLVNTSFGDTPTKAHTLVVGTYLGSWHKPCSVHTNATSIAENQWNYACPIQLSYVLYKASK